MKKYLLTYLKEYYNDPSMDRVLDYFKAELDNYLYAYGCQFGEWDNYEAGIKYMYEGGSPKIAYYKKIKKVLLDFFYSVRHQVYVYIIKHFSHTYRNNQSDQYKKVLFLDHVSLKTRAEFEKKNIAVFSIGEYDTQNNRDIHNIFEWYKSLNKLTFKERLELERYKCLDGFINSIKNTFNDFDGLFVGNDEYFISKLFIDAFKSMHIPTYNWSHGIEAAVGLEMRTDYKLVWGDKLKDNLIKDGKKEEAILISGNINYFDSANLTAFRNSLDDVLVLTSVTIGHVRHVWDYEQFGKWDRSLLITYIYSVEKVLKSLGVKHARLRPHPMNNKLWVDKFIDTDFFSMDNLSLEMSLERATLAIGPTSSTFVEALRKGVTYLVYEPGGGRKGMTDIPLVKPFDGSDPNIKVAFTEEGLKELIVSKYSYNKNVLDNYMKPFDINSFIHTLGKKN